MITMSHLFVCLFALCNFVLPTKEANQPNLIKGKLVYTSCASVVVQIQDERFYNLANTSWKSVDSETKYEHVFLVKNSCNFREKRIERDEEFYFVLLPDVSSNDGCVQCLKYESTPRVILSIDVAKTTNKSY